jgi:hypothetical protein
MPLLLLVVLFLLELLLLLQQLLMVLIQLLPLTTVSQLYQPNSLHCKHRRV